MQRISGKNGEKHKENANNDVYDGSWWEAIEIIGERKNEYKVSWAGIDPATGKTYKPCWVRKSDCTEELLNTWIKNHKQRKTKKSLNITKKKLVDDANTKKYKRRKTSDDYHNEKRSLNVSNEKKYKNMTRNKHCDSHMNCSSTEVLGIQDMLDEFDFSLLSVEDSQNKSYIKPFLFLESSQNISEAMHSVDSVPTEPEDSKNFNNTLKTYHVSEKLDNLPSSMDSNTHVKEEIMETSINDISMSRIFGFSEFPKKSLNIENDNDQDTFLEDTVSSIYHITNDNNIEQSNFQMDMFPKSDSIFIVDNNISNISSNKHEEHVHENDKTVVFKETDTTEENALKNTHYDNISTNDARRLKSPLLSEKVSTWLSYNESTPLEVFDANHTQVSSSVINVEKNQSNSDEYNYSATCISIESELPSETEKDNISVKSRASYEKISEKYDSDISTASTYDNFFVFLKSIQNKSHVYFFGIEMNKIQRNMYSQLILQYNGLIQEFSSSLQHDKVLIKKIQRFMSIMTMLTVHPYLILKQKKSVELLGRIELKHLVHSSPKFQFLACFLEKSKNLKLLVGIVSDNEMLLDLLEILVQKLNIPYLKINQYSENVDINKANAKVLLIVHGRDKGNDAEAYCDLVICIYTSTHILSKRNFDCQSNKKMKKYIIPITINSVEHIQLCIMKDIPRNLYFQNATKIIILLRKFAGILPSNQFFSNESAQLVYNWVEKNYKDRWMLPIISDIRELVITLSHKDNRLISEMQLNNLIELEEKICQHDNYLYDELYQEIQETSNMTIKNELFDNNDKKILENLSNQFEMSRLQSNVHNSVANDQLNYLTLNLETIQKPYLDNVKISNSVKTKWEFLYAEISELKGDLYRTQNLLKNTENELSNFKIVSERLQTRYEEMQEQYRDLNLKFESTINTKNELQKRFNTLQEDFTHLKENRNLSQVGKLKNIFPSSEQEDTTIDVLYDSEKAHLLEENLRLKKVIENKVSDFEFLRSQYQEASSSAANLAGEIKQLEAENLRLKNKAEGEAVRLKEMMIQLLEKNMNERIEELEIQNSLYFEQLKQKIKNETTKQLYVHDRHKVIVVSQDTETDLREPLVRNQSFRDLESLNGYSISKTIMNFNEF
ncbi:hypothetical protein PCANB_002055 [Pneumocystis canis]|nr:hypothetical protein PCANB_002055 [Pneumocystis canis]